MIYGKLGLVLLALGTIAASRIHSRIGSDPRVWQSDVKVESLDVSESRSGGSINARAVISTSGDDAARSVKVEVMLPIGVGVLRLSDGCKPSPSPVTGLTARVTCDLGEIPTRGSREIAIATTARPSSIPLRIGIFAFSDTPDPSPANNFAERNLQ
jgi:hypothetical protein